MAATAFFGAGFSSSLSELLDEDDSFFYAFLAGALATGLASESSLSESEEEESFFLAAALATAFLTTGLASDESLSESEDESFAAAFLAGAATVFLTGLASDESESEDESFLAATFFAGAAGAGFLATTLTDSSDESESDELSTGFFFCGTLEPSVFFAALDDEALLTFEAALGLFVATTGFLSESLLSLSLEDELESFFACFLVGLASTFFDFEDLSTDCFLLGASLELALTFFVGFYNYIN